VDRVPGIRRALRKFSLAMIHRTPPPTAGGPPGLDDDVLLIELGRALQTFDPLPAEVAAAARDALARTRGGRDLPSSGDPSDGDAAPLRWAFFDPRGIAP
jgi:hypothetical protein